MNGTEQKQRRTAIIDLQRRLDSMDRDFSDLVLQEVKDRRADAAQLRETIRIEVSEERTHRLQLAIQQREYVDDQDRQQVRILLAFIMMPFWKRWVWCVLGGGGVQRLEMLINNVQARYRDLVGRP
jgi:hypothetical protein